jgi:hypothetical protein
MWVDKWLYILQLCNYGLQLGSASIAMPEIEPNVRGTA